MQNYFKIKDRLNEALRLRNMSAAELSQKCGLNKSSLSRYLTGENIPRSRAIQKMAAALDVSPVWLLGYDVTIDGDEIIRIDYDKLSEANKARLLAYYQALLETQKEAENGNGKME